jgi:hypothetical protein
MKTSTNLLHFQTKFAFVTCYQSQFVGIGSLQSDGMSGML